MSAESSGHLLSHHTGASHAHHSFPSGLTSEIVFGQDSFLADTMGHKDLEQVICDFIELVNLLDMCPHDCLLFLEHSNRSVNFDIHFVLILEVLQSDRDFILTFLVKNHFEGASIVIDFEKSSHRLFCALDDTSNYNDIIDGFAFDFANVVRARTRLVDHLHSDWGKDSILAAVSMPTGKSIVVSLLFDSGAHHVSSRGTNLIRHKEASVA